MLTTEDLNLIKLFRKIDDCQFCRRERNPLRHILGVGQTQKPKFALILINPTHLNVSSQSTWTSARFPFIGVRHFWKVFERAGIISSFLLKKIYQNDWRPKTLKRISRELADRSVYLTNLVKCTQEVPDYPSREKIAYGKSQLVEELSIIQPKYVICFGLLTFKELTGRVVKLDECFSEMRKGKIRSFNPSPEFSFIAQIFPCYFPAGRGNPARASEMLHCYLDNL